MSLEDRINFQNRFTQDGSLKWVERITEAREKIPHGHDESCEGDWDYGQGQVSSCQCEERSKEES